MNEKIKRRALMHGLLYLKDEESTIRDIAKSTGYSKTTVCKDFHRLEHINYELYTKVQIKSNKNFLNKHIKGGETTKKKHMKLEDL